MVDKWCLENPEKCKESKAKWRVRNRERLRQYAVDYKADNPEKTRQQNADWYRNNKLYKNNWHRKNKARRVKEDVSFRIACNMRSRFYAALKRNSKTTSAVKDLGCSIKELRSHLERLFQDGMSWDNYGEWHIDHVQPLASFNLTDAQECKKACHYTNLQPLWAAENQSKGATFEVEKE